MASNLSKYHVKCRTCEKGKPVFYQIGKNESQVERPIVPDKYVEWQNVWTEYKTVPYTAPIVKSQPEWADKLETKGIKWNQIDGRVNRKSHHGPYKLVKQVSDTFESVNDVEKLQDKENLYPLNPVGRTGLIERGLLGKWGPNHAADPVVTRWKRDAKGEPVKIDGKKVLEFVAIQRVDTGEWAIPGGMCDPGEAVSLTLKREFMEEAFNTTKKTVEDKKKIEEKLNKLFAKGKEVYKGYVDDPRNTDNAWMETIVVNFHDEDNTMFRDFTLEAGDDARKVKWMEINSKLKLYASHTDFIKQIVDLHKAHW